MTHQDAAVIILLLALINLKLWFPKGTNDINQEG